jgi:hypothetical protein
MHEAERIIIDDNEEIDYHSLDTASFKYTVSTSPTHSLQ